jgi:hypothetical protein
MIGPLLLAILFWVVYFLIIFFICRRLYRWLSGPEPEPHAVSVIIQGKSILAREVWERRAKRLQRLVILLAVVLMVLPLFLPFVFAAFLV